MYAPLPSLPIPDSQSLRWYKEDYDLVKIHHPDSAHCRHLDPSTRHARFQSIRSAYDYLMGKGYTSSGSYDPAFSELDRIRRAQEAHRRARRRAAEFADGFGKKREWEASPDDRAKDRMIFFVGVLVSTQHLSYLLYSFRS